MEIATLKQTDFHNDYLRAEENKSFISRFQEKAWMNLWEQRAGSRDCSIWGGLMALQSVTKH